MEKKTAAVFEVEAAGMEQFLELLELREARRAHDPGRGGEPASRRAVFVTQMYDAKGSSIGAPSVRRYVVAAFALGDDLVRFERTTSRGIEFPNAPNYLGDGEDPNKRQDEAYEEMRAALAGRIAERGFEVPVLEGALRHSFDPRTKGAS